MASATSGVAKMILQYDWKVETESKAMCFLTPMMLFRGVKVFRFGFKNYSQSPMLFIIAVDLEQIGLKLPSVSYALKAESESIFNNKSLCNTFKMQLKNFNMNEIINLFPQRFFFLIKKALLNS